MPKMFKQSITHFKILNGNFSYYISGLYGTLFSSREEHYSPRSSFGLQPKIRNAFERCANPYLLSTCPVQALLISPQLLPEEMKLGISFAKKLIWLSRNQFLCARFYASRHVPLFASAREATLFFRKNAKGDQDELCLARALFAAKTSRRFAHEGAIVIGVFLPSRAMHAWVIEGDEVADPYDGIWINYQPVAMLS